MGGTLLVVSSLHIINTQIDKHARPLKRTFILPQLFHFPVSTLIDVGLYMLYTLMSIYRAACPIPIMPMLQVAEVGRTDSHCQGDLLLTQKQAIDREDDWTGVTDAGSRRKKQTRLNTRAWRK